MPSIKKKPAQKQVSKSVVSNIKSKPKWKLGILAVVLVFVLTTVGYVGYGKYQEHTLKAHAMSDTYLGYSSSGMNVSACKKYVNAYGGVWQIRATFYQLKGNLNPLYDLASIRNGNTVVDGDKIGSTYWNGTIAQQTVNLSAVYGDKFVATINGGWQRGGPTTWSTGLLSPSSVSCTY